ncbi:peroxisome biosynthesis protein-like protein [Leptomonas pyrrhocoris]|uniref:Peroxisomal ATPase PEX1 n=1 Tax=Leptomonas pyrrhocoris TaxID=157538 RepID=A0A0M9G4U7_LEPPY|nr:peroxisome biosynthesis protein-like protein [Leptomonas pyrrhocoris]KPA82450.1 peroxisome biosynthesis protein-like protein [Leptomonas pyrrhocoris]|eukprot:XP_015660889.1 peroxisome biosynthesis protein-like protein [Leptomonas pyrrhocoris]
MQQSSFEVAVSRNSQHSFVTVSQNYLNSVLQPLYSGHLPPAVPLRITGQNGKDIYVGCLTANPHNLSKFKILFPLTLCTDLGLSEGELVECVPLSNAPRATKVLVAPLTVDDSEVVEQNALRIENLLLRQVQVVFPSMIISVAIYAGVTAKVIVTSIECGASEEKLRSGCATMHEGTHFVIATRVRRELADAAAGNDAPPLWAFVRGRPSPRASAQPRGDATAAAVAAAGGEGGTVKVGSAMAENYHWKNGTVLGALDCAMVATLDKEDLTPGFLRTYLKTVVVSVEEVRTTGEDGKDETDVCELDFLAQATNVLLTPHAIDAPAATAAAETTVEAQNDVTEAAQSPLMLPSTALSLDDVAKVHGSVAHELRQHLLAALHQSAMPHFANLHHNNVLLCGGKGFGKTTVVRAVLSTLPDVHTVSLECGKTKSFSADVAKALTECVLCKPAVLVLENFDSIAPAQQEGNVAAMSAMTQATLECTLTRFCYQFSVRPAGAVVVLATCSSRDAVHESLRSAYCFRQVLTLESLNRASRTVLATQLFPSAPSEEVAAAAALMDNYTPFDVKQLASRMRAKLAADPSLSLRACAEACVASFTPLAHTGISFLKGDKVSWESIGGLEEAKKVLYNTLVLPIKHPQLFARLPLKTRSGILLYGPSGCGKTFILESLINAENLHCIVINGPEVFGKYIGQSEQKIRDVFERAQAAAPCVVFFDEFDSVAPQRGADDSGVTDRVVNQLLCYLDGVEGRKDVFVVAASSRPDLIDAALLRPGRLDKAVVCPVPSEDDRVAILRSLLSKTSAQFSDDELLQVAQRTEKWTPADLSAMVSSANTLVNMRFMENLTQQAAARSKGAGGGLLGGDGEEDGFVIANLGGGVTREKVSDALKPLAQAAVAGGAASGRAALAAEQMTMDDLWKSVDTTRPSLSEKDIQKHERIHALFSKGKTIPPPKPPGTRLVTR